MRFYSVKFQLPMVCVASGGAVAVEARLDPYTKAPGQDHSVNCRYRQAGDQPSHLASFAKESKSSSGDDDFDKRHRKQVLCP